MIDCMQASYQQVHEAGASLAQNLAHNHAKQAQCVAACLSDTSHATVVQAPLLVQAAVFAAFTLSGHVLTPDLAFPALALLNQLSMPLFFLPDQIGSFVQGRVSIRRIQAFLDEPEMMQLPFKPCAEEGATAVSVSHGVYSWEPGKVHLRAENPILACLH